MGNLLVERVRGEVDLHPDEHAPERPDEVVHEGFLDNTPFFADASAAAGFDLVLTVFEDGAHGLHAALVVSTESLEPAHPASGAPPTTVLGAASATVIG